MKKILKNISEFKYKINKSQLKDPIKLQLPHTEFWKLHLLKLYFYSQEGKEPFNAYDLQDILSLSLPHVYKHLNNFIEKGYIEKVNKGTFKFTEKGIEKALEIKEKD